MPITHSMSVFFTLHGSSTRRHPAHAVSALILRPGEIQALWSQNYDTGSYVVDSSTTWVLLKDPRETIMRVMLSSRRQPAPGMDIYILQGASLRGRQSPIAGANWRLENPKSPAAMLQEDNTDATCSTPRMYLRLSGTRIGTISE